MRFKMMLALTATALALTAACGGESEEAVQPSPTLETSPVSSGGSMAPDVFMTFESRRYRAQDVGSDLVSLDEVELAGSTNAIDIDHSGPVEVYRLKEGPRGVLYTFESGRPLPEEVGRSTPDVWLEWAPVEGGTGQGGSAAPGGVGGSGPAEPGATPAESEPTVVEPVAPPPRPGPTLSPDDVVSATPVPGTDTIPSAPDPSTLVKEARAHLAQRLAVSVATVEVVSVNQEGLPHPSCLNLQPGQGCIMIAALGYRVTLAVDGVEYVYYAYSEGQVYPVP